MQRTILPSPSSLSIQSPAIRPHSMSAFKDFASMPAFGTISSSCLVTFSSSCLSLWASSGTCPAFTSSCLGASSSSCSVTCLGTSSPTSGDATVGLHIDHGSTSEGVSFFDGSRGRLPGNGPCISGIGSLYVDGVFARYEKFTKDHAIEISKATSYKMNTGSSYHHSFMSERVGSTVLPSPLGEFNKGLGNDFFVPPIAIRIRDDGQDPAHARLLMESMQPLLLASMSTKKPIDKLVEDYYLHTFNSSMSGIFMHKSFEREVNRLKGDLETRTFELARLREEFEKEKSAFSSSRKDKEELETKCSSLKIDLETALKERDNATKERDTATGQVSSLKDELNALDIRFKHKEFELDGLKSSSQDEINCLKVDLETERGLKAELVEKLSSKEAELVDAITKRQETLAAFPELFKRLISHEGVKKLFDDFNKACFDFARHDASKKIRRAYPQLNLDLPYYNPRTLAIMKDVGKALQEKSFPILEEIVRDLDLPIDEILSRFAPASAA